MNVLSSVQGGPRSFGKHFLGVISMQIQRSRIASNAETQDKVKFLDNHNANLLDELRNMFAGASEAYIAVAFVRASGVALLSEPIR